MIWAKSAVQRWMFALTREGAARIGLCNNDAADCSWKRHQKIEIVVQGAHLYPDPNPSFQSLAYHGARARRSATIPAPIFIVTKPEVLTGATSGDRCRYQTQTSGCRWRDEINYHHSTLTEEVPIKMDVRRASRTLLAGSWIGEAPGKARQEDT